MGRTRNPNNWMPIDKEQVSAICKEKGISTLKELSERIIDLRGIPDIANTSKNSAGNRPSETLYPNLVAYLNKGKITLSLMMEICCVLDVAPEVLAGKTDLRMPYRKGRAIFDGYAINTDNLLDAILASSTLNQLELSDLSKEDGAALLNMIRLSCLYFVTNKGYIQSPKHGDHNSDGQLLDMVQSIMKAGAPEISQEPKKTATKKTK